MILESNHPCHEPTEKVECIATRISEYAKSRGFEVQMIEKTTETEYKVTFTNGHYSYFYFHIR